MAQLSRPYQIALAGLGVLVLAWFAVLHRPGSGSSSSSSSESSSAPAAHVYHGAAPGVEGLTRDIAKAHGAVATSEKNAAQLQSKSAQASGEAAPAGATAQAAPRTPTASATAGVSARHSGSTSGHGLTGAAARAKIVGGILSHELAQHKTVLLLFWNPKSSDDAHDAGALHQVAAHLRGSVFTHVTTAKQVGLYGSVTRGVQVLQTPTLLIVGKHGVTVTLTGLLDPYAIEQGILEAKKAAAKQ